MNHFENFDCLYHATLRNVHSEFEHENSPRGQSEYEVVGYSARLQNPRSRYSLSIERKQNIVFNFAEALWYLSGRNDLAFIQHYAPSMEKYSPDGITLPGTGYGKRLRHYAPNDLDQIERAIDVLKNDDADSKRVVLQIFSADEDIYKHNIDVSCTLGLQLLLRDNRLNMVSFMRANDAYIGFLNDIFSFTFLQEYIAARIRCDLGHYTHQVGSIHIYSRMMAKARDVISSQKVPLNSQQLPVMPSCTTKETIMVVLSHEASIRNAQENFDTLVNCNLPNYWKDILIMFWIYGEIKQGSQVPEKVLNHIHPYYRPFLENRWPRVWC